MKKLLIFILLVINILFIKIEPFSIDKYSSNKIKVMVNGEVANPGYVELDIYASYQDLLDKVELLNDADTSQINPSIILKDKDIINIPTKMENKLISINTADIGQLTLLPGIGESTAQKIIDYRKTNGLFQTLDDLTKVSGIGDAKLSKMIEFICL